ncbi:MAG: hypothetical protein U0U09_00325 [Cyclobacteriaceae bacterium]
MMTRTIIVLISLMLIVPAIRLAAQIPVEVFGGNRKASFDAMFFRYFTDEEGKNSRFLFFSRARSTVDYRITKTENLPTFGFTEAFSYNHPGLKGFAPVAVVQIFNAGVYPKAGVQYFHASKNFTLFTWVVCETLRDPDWDGFLLLRFTPAITEKIHLFTQLESVNTVPSDRDANFNFIQRMRLGLGFKTFQFGAGADFTEAGNEVFVNVFNVGGFLRYEFR